jgi:diadenylate cyclase
MSQILNFLTNFKVSDFFDIAIISVIIYRFLLIVQGTRAVQMLFGLGGLALLFWMSLRYKLYSLSWLLDQFLEYSFIILIILFQDAIRTALVTIGGTSLLSRTGDKTDLEVIEEIVQACGALSREKTGALIVFEKSNGLLNYAKTGTRLDSKIHSDILYTLFQNSSPLHDGAVIIFDGRIQAAGCFLPLSKNVELDRHFGTRHRAALGVTEVSDAVVVTVSEETGKVTVCFNRNFNKVSSEEELRKSLRKFLINDSSALKLDSVNI